MHLGSADKIISSELYKQIQDVSGFDFEEIDEDLPVLEIPKAGLIRVLAILDSNASLSYSRLTDIIVVDRPENEKRFEINYLLFSLVSQTSLNIRIFIEEEEPVDSIVYIHKSAYWHECEINEFFGIVFSNNYKSQSLILPEGYNMFPLRKDF